MNYSKIDAPLNEALSETSAKDESHLTVFIRAGRDLDQKEAAELWSLGVEKRTGKGQIFTATLSPNAIDKLSHKSWVRSIKLSRKLRPLESD